MWKPIAIAHYSDALLSLFLFLHIHINFVMDNRLSCFGNHFSITYANQLCIYLNEDGDDDCSRLFMAKINCSIMFADHFVSYHFVNKHNRFFLGHFLYLGWMTDATQFWAFYPNLFTFDIYSCASRHIYFFANFSILSLEWWKSKRDEIRK